MTALEFDLAAIKLSAERIALVLDFAAAAAPAHHLSIGAGHLAHECIHVFTQKHILGCERTHVLISVLVVGMAVQRCAPIGGYGPLVGLVVLVDDIERIRARWGHG